MKVKPEHVAQLRALVASGILRIPPREAYETRDATRVRNAASIKDPAKRYRWDALYAAGANEVLSDIYRYANNEHIDTALRSIVR